MKILLSISIFFFVLSINSQTNTNVISYQENCATHSYINVLDYGATNDDLFLDDVAIQRAIDSAKVKDVSIYFPSGKYHISKQINLREHNTNVGLFGDGINATKIYVQPKDSISIKDDFPVYNNIPGNHAIISRSNYASFKDFQLIGDRNFWLGGIHFYAHGGYGTHENIWVKNFNGSGIRYDKIFDSYVENLIIIDCGNNKEYAFSVNKDDDTSNHTNFNRIQIEKAHDKAINIDRDNINLVFTNIHSERLIRDVSTKNDVSHKLGGVSSTYINLRIEGISDEPEFIEISGANSTFQNLRLNDSKLRITNGNSPTYINIDNLTVGDLEIPNTNISNIIISNSIINNKTFITKQIGDHPVYFSNTQFFGSLEHDGNGSKVIFSNCIISSNEFVITGNTTNEFQNSKLKNNVNLVGGFGSNFVFKGCEVDMKITTPFGSTWKAYSTHFDDDLTLSNNNVRFRGFSCTFSGNLSYSAGNAYAALDSGCQFLVPDKIFHENWYNPFYFEIGTKAYNLKPTYANGQYTNDILLKIKVADGITKAIKIH